LLNISIVNSAIQELHPFTVFGNRQFFIMRQNDRADLDDMGNDIALPKSRSTRS
jgi:hypothetical protein